MEDNDIRDKRERLVACVLSGNSKQYLGKEYTEQQINEMDCNDVNTLINRYESVLSAQMTKSLDKSVINLYSNIACSVLDVGNQQELSTNLESDPFLNMALQRFTCNLYYRFGAFLAPVSVGLSMIMDSEILDQLTTLEKNVVTKPKRGRRKKADTKINELEDNDIRDKRERLVACILSGNSKQYLGKEYTEQQIKEMDCNDVH